MSSFADPKDQGSFLRVSSEETCRDTPALPEHLRPLIESVSNKLSGEQIS